MRENSWRRWDLNWCDMNLLEYELQDGPGVKVVFRNLQ